MNNKYIKQAKNIIQWYREGSDLTEDQKHLLYDCAGEYG